MIATAIARLFSCRKHELVRRFVDCYRAMEGFQYNNRLPAGKTCEITRLNMCCQDYR